MRGCPPQRVHTALLGNVPCELELFCLRSFDRRLGLDTEPDFGEVKTLTSSGMALLACRRALPAARTASPLGWIARTSAREPRLAFLFLGQETVNSWLASLKWSTPSAQPFHTPSPHQTESEAPNHPIPASAGDSKMHLCRRIACLGGTCCEGSL